MAATSRKLPDFKESLEDMLSTSDGLGRIETVVETQPVSSFHILHSLVHHKDINVRNRYDLNACNITGCALLSPGKLVVTDRNNTNVKIVDIKKQPVDDEYTLPNFPVDVTVLPHDQVAVTLPPRKEIQILKTRKKLTFLRSINVNGKCQSITYHHDLLYVLCLEPNVLFVLDMQGTEQRNIPLKSALNEIFGIPYCIIICKNLQQLYISDWKSNMVVSLTLQGKVTAVYKNDDLKKPRGIAVLGDGSLLVCCDHNGTIYNISADLTQGRKVAECIPRARSMCYDSVSKTAYVSNFNCDHIRVFSLK